MLCLLCDEEIDFNKYPHHVTKMCTMCSYKEADKISSGDVVHSLFLCQKHKEKTLIVLRVDSAWNMCECSFHKYNKTAFVQAKTKWECTNLSRCHEFGAGYVVGLDPLTLVSGMAQPEIIRVGKQL